MIITVNGIEHTVQEDRPLSYASVFALAYGGMPLRQGASITYTWRGEGDASRNGIIHAGKEVIPADGMRVTCVFTGNA